jgi:hypothetical protein
MKIRQVVLLAAVAVQFVGVVPAAQPPAPQPPDYNAFYQIGPDSLPHEGVPKGEVRNTTVSTDVDDAMERSFNAPRKE